MGWCIANSAIRGMVITDSHDTPPLEYMFIICTLTMFSLYNVFIMLVS